MDFGYQVCNSIGCVRFRNSRWSVPSKFDLSSCNRYYDSCLKRRSHFSSRWQRCESSRSRSPNFSSCTFVIARYQHPVPHLILFQVIALVLRKLNDVLVKSVIKQLRGFLGFCGTFYALFLISFMKKMPFCEKSYKRGCKLVCTAFLPCPLLPFTSRCSVQAPVPTNVLVQDLGAKPRSAHIGRHFQHDS